MSVRIHPPLVLLAALATLGGCNSSVYQRVVSVNPSNAAVYINGEPAGMGDPRPKTFDFSELGRVYVQATHPDYLPYFEWFTREQMENMIDTNTDLKITLRGR